MTDPALHDVPAAILLVDDHTENLVALEAVLEPLGHTLLRATSGEEALKHLLVHNVALILLDVRMPGMDGFETARRIKERERTAEIPIIFLTAYSKETAFAMQGFSTGAVDYVTKPFEPGLLRAKVEVFVDLYQKTEQLRRHSAVLASRLDQRFETEARNLRKLADAAVVINSTLSLKEILRVINESAREVIGAHSAETTITSARDVHGAEYSRSVSGKYAGRPDAGPDDLAGLYQVVFDRNEPVRMTKKEIAAAFAALGIHHVEPGHPMLEGWLAAPLTGRTGRTLGLIQVADKIEGEFGEGDEVVLVQLAQLAAVAIENAERYEHEHRIAETLQRSLLPDDLPSLGGVEIDASYRPGSVGTQVGGDWYDVFVLDDRRVALVVGDVVGRGTRAAAVMGQLRTAIRAYAVHGLRPTDLMAGLDRLLQDLSGSAMATAVYGVLDLETRVLETVHAGHPPILLVPAGGRARYLDVEANVPLGVQRSPVYRSSRFELEAGSVVAFFTDGLVESLTVPIQEGMARLLRVVEQSVRPGAVAGLAATVIDAMVPDRAQDDIALLIGRIGS